MLPNHEEQMREALKQARLSAANSEVPVGAVIIRDGEIIASAHNETEQRRCAIAHAEILAIERASAKLSRWRLDDCQLFVTLEPCPMCIGAIVLARIPELYFGCHDPKLGAVGSLFDLSAHNFCGEKLTVYSGLLADECRGVLQDFFKSRR